MPQITLNQAELAAERAELADFLAQPNAYSSPDFSAKNKRFTELETLLGVPNAINCAPPSPGPRS